MDNEKSVNTTSVIWEELCGPIMTREDVLLRLKNTSEVYREFLRLSKSFQEELFAYAMGVKGARMTYDPFFKSIFDPDKYKHRLEGFLEACLGEPVKIEEVIKNESGQITEDSSFLIEDLLFQ